MDPMPIVAILGAAGVFFQQIVNFKETKRRLDEIEIAHKQCLEERQEERKEREDERRRLTALETEAKTVAHIESVFSSKSDSDRRFIKQQFEDLTATYDLKKKRITHIQKHPPAGETVGDE